MINIKLGYRLLANNLVHSVIVSLLVAVIMFLISSFMGGLLSTKKALTACAGLEDIHGIHIVKNDTDIGEMLGLIPNIREVYSQSSLSFLITDSNYKYPLHSSCNLNCFNLEFLKKLDIPLAKGKWLEEAESEGIINVVVSRDFGYELNEVIECINFENQSFKIKVVGILKDRSYYPKLKWETPSRLDTTIIREYTAFKYSANRQISPLVIGAYNSQKPVPDYLGSGIYIFDNNQQLKVAEEILKDYPFAVTISELFANTKQNASLNSKIYLFIGIVVLVVVVLALVSAAYISFDKGYKYIYIFFMLGCDRKNIFFGFLYYFAYIYVLALAPYILARILATVTLVASGFMQSNVWADILSPMIFYVITFCVFVAFSAYKSKVIVKKAARRPYAK